MKDMRKWDEKFTALQGYNAMRQFLKAFGTLTHSDHILALYTRAALLNNGITADPVVLHQWAWCVNQALTEAEMDFFQLYPNGNIPVYKKIEHFPEVIQDPNQVITYLEGYNAVRKFLDIYYFDLYSGDIGVLVGSMAILPPYGPPIDRALWNDWLDAIEVVLKKDNSVESVLK